MGIEIERKFLVTGTGWRTPDALAIKQGYLNRDKARTVRVRLVGGRGFVTIKGLTIRASRSEFEYEVPFDDAQAMLALCDGPLVEKLRHRVSRDGVVWEIDEFDGENAGLVVAEIELVDEQQSFVRPDWLGAEVTDDARYFNSNLATTPYSRWQK